MGVDHAVRCLAEPFGRLAFVLFDADALGEADPVVEGRDQVARGRGLFKPLARSDRVVFMSMAAQNEIAEIDARVGVAAIGGLAEQACRLGRW